MKKRIKKNKIIFELLFILILLLIASQITIAGPVAGSTGTVASLSITKSSTCSTVACRNNNPGNIMSNGQFVKYSTWDEGVAALNRQAGLIISGDSNQYKSMFGNADVTPTTLIGQWSPANAQGNTQASTTSYANFVANELGICPTCKIDDTPINRVKVASAIAQFESTVGSGNIIVTAQQSASTDSLLSRAVNTVVGIISGSGDANAAEQAKTVVTNDIGKVVTLNGAEITKTGENQYTYVKDNVKYTYDDQLIYKCGTIKDPTCTIPLQSSDKNINIIRTAILASQENGVTSSITTDTTSIIIKKEDGKFYLKDSGVEVTQIDTDDNGKPVYQFKGSQGDVMLFDYKGDVIQSIKSPSLTTTSTNQLSSNNNPAPSFPRLTDYTVQSEKGLLTLQADGSFKGSGGEIQPAKNDKGEIIPDKFYYVGAFGTKTEITDTNLLSSLKANSDAYDIQLEKYNSKIENYDIVDLPKSALITVSKAGSDFVDAYDPKTNKFYQSNDGGKSYVLADIKPDSSEARVVINELYPAVPIDKIRYLPGITSANYLADIPSDMKIGSFQVEVGNGNIIDLTNKKVLDASGNIIGTELEIFSTGGYLGVAQGTRYSFKEIKSDGTLSVINTKLETDDKGNVVSQLNSFDFQRDLPDMYAEATAYGNAFSTLGSWLGVYKNDKVWIDISQTALGKYLSVDDFVSNTICSLPVDENSVATAVFLADTGEVGAHIEGYAIPYNDAVLCKNQSECDSVFHGTGTVSCDKGYCISSNNERVILKSNLYKLSLKFSPSSTVVNPGQKVKFYVRLYPGGEIYDLNRDMKGNASDQVILSSGSDSYNKITIKAYPIQYTKVCMELEGDLSQIFTPQFYKVWQEIASGNQLCNTFEVGSYDLGNDGASFGGIVDIFAKIGTLGKGTTSQGTIGNTAPKAGSATSGGASSGTGDNRP